MERRKKGIKERNPGGITYTKGRMRGYIETYYCGSVFKYIHILNKSKWTVK